MYSYICIYTHVYTYIYICIYIIYIYLYVQVYDNFGTIIVKHNQNCTATLASRYNHEICYTIRSSLKTNSDVHQIARWDLHFPIRYIYRNMYSYTYIVTCIYKYIYRDTEIDIDKDI